MGDACPGHFSASLTARKMTSVGSVIQTPTPDFALFRDALAGSGLLAHLVHISVGFASDQVER